MNFIVMLDNADRKVKCIQLTLEDKEAYKDFNDDLWDFAEFYLSKHYNISIGDIVFMMECNTLDIELIKRIS